MTIAKPNITIKRLRTGNPWDIAKELGIRYSGDMNTIPHGGTYYETSNWEANGYCDFVRFQESEGTLYVELGTANRPDDMLPALKCIGMDDSEESDNMLVQIEACLAYGHYDIDTCQTFESDNGTDWGDFPEFRIYQYAKRHIVDLACK